MMLSGAVAGLRNPRADRLMKDDPERAPRVHRLVSLLAKRWTDASASDETGARGKPAQRRPSIPRKCALKILEG